MSSAHTILITGGNTGLGLEIVKALCSSPDTYNIIIGSRSVKKAEDAIAGVQKDNSSSKSTLSAVQVDVESDDSINAAFQEVSSKHGHIDTLINNAGAGLGKATQNGEYSLREGWNKTWDIVSRVQLSIFSPSNVH